jgi:hypothetical protein
MKGNHLHIEDHDMLIKDTRTSAIVSLDQSAYDAALKRKKHKTEFDTMKNDIGELKTLVSLLIQKLDK